MVLASILLLQSQTVELKPVVPEKESIRWSPKGAQIELTSLGGGLSGSFRLGPEEAGAIAVRLSKSDGANRFDRLWVDLDRDGKEDSGESYSASPNERNGKWWSSFSGVTVPVPMGAREFRPYPINLWFVEDPLEPEAAPLLRWSRRGWHEGVTEIDGSKAFVLITERVMDGVFDQRDSWFLARDRAALLGMSRNLEDHAWLDGKAYRPVKIDRDGRSISFEEFEPQLTQEDEAAQRDPYAADRGAARAEKPVAFGHDFEAAVASAKASGKRLFVDFEATWCGPCKTMDELVYAAQAVVDAASGVVPVKVDGDVRRDLAKQFDVGAYPTMILLDAEGTEIRRAVGYRGVKAMVEFFK